MSGRASASAAPKVVKKAETAAERRLSRLALDVHDGPMQNLAAIGFTLGDLQRRLSTVVPVKHRTELQGVLARIGAELSEVESDLRELIASLDGGTPRTVSLRQALEDEIRFFAERSTAAIAFEVDGEPEARTDSQLIALQAVVRASLANVAQHAQATQVTVRLRSTADTTTVEIEDNGRGFRVASAARRAPRAFWAEWDAGAHRAARRSVPRHEQARWPDEGCGHAASLGPTRPTGLDDGGRSGLRR